MKITATFLDEISHDIPHQNWGEQEWEADFKAMKSIGINTAVLIRCGYKDWITYPSQVLRQKEGCFMPPFDLVDMFLRLGEQYGIDIYLGGYDSGKYWNFSQFEQEVEINFAVIDELWENYGHRRSFRGWYLPHEVSRNSGRIIDLYARMGRRCKEVSGGLPVLVSPYIDGKKAVLAAEADLTKDEEVSLRQHEKEWNEILGGIKGAVDIIAFQDGHVDYHQLPDYLSVNKSLAHQHGLQCWTNCESFDRDMPIKFLPIKWEKLLLKLQAAEKAGIERAITFEFSHFMSPHSSYQQAHHLFNRYCEHFRIN